MTTLSRSTDSLMCRLDDQQFWRATLGLDLADRTVLEAEVLIWRIVAQKATTTIQRETNQTENESVT
jgi:hypothetical protein